MSMSDTIVSFEIAKLAKEKGFKANTTKYYTPNSHKLVYSLYIVKHNTLRIPTYSQSLLQKWLREKHNIHIIILTGKGDKIWWSFQLIEISTNELLLDWDNSKDTYEEALEEGLKEGLKLIKQY